MLTEPDEPVNSSGDDLPERAQRIVNELKRKELEERYGAVFSSPDASEIPSEVEAQWLEHIDEFERQFENAAQVLLREFIGSPSVRPLADIPPSEVVAELDALLDLLGENEVVVDFPDEVDDAEAYRFITEELLDEEIDDIRVPGMVLHFMYSEFHPGEDEDDDFDDLDGIADDPR
jgi:hypothetical protein